MAAMQLSSRFGVLRVDDSPDLDSGDEVNPTNKKEKEAKAAVEAAKKKSKKKRKAQQQSNAKAELREMTFTKIASVPKALTTEQPAPKPIHQRNEVLQIGSPPANTKDWQKWQEKDQEYVDDQYQRDIQRAILQSKLDYERQKKFFDEIGSALDNQPQQPQPQPQPMNRKERRKHMQGKEKPQPMSLQEFHQASEGSSAKGGGDVGLDNIELPETTPPEENKEILSSVKEEVNKILAKDTKKKTKKKKEVESQKLNEEIDSVRKVQYEDELERKTAETVELNKLVEKLREELAQVKKRNKQLCFILAQGEMKDKADVLNQVEELTSVKDELTTEVSELHAALEQERSKVSGLKLELQRIHEKKK